MKELDNRKFVELLRMMAGQDEGGYGEVFREAARRIEELMKEKKKWEISVSRVLEILGEEKGS